MDATLNIPLRNTRIFIITINYKLKYAGKKSKRRKQALKQARAIYASGWREIRRKSNLIFENQQK